MHKRIVVHPQNIFDFALGSCHRTLCEWLPAGLAFIPDKQVEPRSAIFSPAMTLALNPIKLIIQLEFEIYQHFGAAQMHQGVFRFAAGLAPQRPGDGIEQG